MHRSIELVLKEYDKDTWQLEQEINIILPIVTARIKIPKGFKTNFASIPKILRSVIDDNEDSILIPSIIHDYLYSKGSIAWTSRTEKFHYVTKKEADQILEHLMKDYGAPYWKYKLVYLTVRLFGDKYWKTS